MAAIRLQLLMDRSLEFYTRLYLQDNILAKVDRASMMNGLEARSVFLDNDLTDYVRRIPDRLKYRNGVRKYILKQALKGLVPKAILTVPKRDLASLWRSGRITSTAGLMEFPKRARRSPSAGMTGTAGLKRTIARSFGVRRCCPILAGNGKTDLLPIVRPFDPYRAQRSINAIGFVWKKMPFYAI